MTFIDAFDVISKLIKYVCAILLLLFNNDLCLYYNNKYNIKIFFWSTYYILDEQIVVGIIMIHDKCNDTKQKKWSIVGIKTNL